MDKVRVFLISFLLILGTCCTVYSDDTKLSVPLVIQEHSDWCWAAVSSAILQYSVSNPPSQCELANVEKGLTYCCGNTTFDWNDKCNQGVALGWIQTLLTNWNVYSKYTDGSILPSAILNDINAYKPFIISFTSTNGPGGHMVVGYGYDSTTTYVDYMDPWSSDRGYMREPYAALLYSPDRTWTETLEMNISVNLPQTGQTSCWDENGNLINCAGTGQDGDLQPGVAWPNPRFTGNGDGTMTDNLTGLMWTQNANWAGVTTSWQMAMNYVATMNSAGTYGYTDWRVPNIIELESLVNEQLSNNATWLHAQGFSDLQSQFPCYYEGHYTASFWSSTTAAYNGSKAWFVSMCTGEVYAYDKSYYGLYVWPVRTGHR